MVKGRDFLIGVSLVLLRKYIAVLSACMKLRYEMILQYILTMPNRGSWNGRWSGEDDLYAICVKYSPKEVERIMKNENQRSWYYRWSDGWSARVEAKVITPKEAIRVRKQSQGFCGYNWMIPSIEQNDEIRT